MYTIGIGETLSLFCALSWAVAVILFRISGTVIRPMALNFFKDFVAVILFLFTMLIIGEPIFRPAPWQDYFWLIVSGILGISFADTFYFKSLNLLGAGMKAVVDCAYSPMVIVVSYIFLGDRMTLFDYIGALLVISAIWVATFRVKGINIEKKSLILGVSLGLLSSLTMGISIVMMKPILDRSSLIWVTEWRLIAGTAALFVMIMLRRDRQSILGSLKFSKNWLHMMPSSVIGAYLAMIFWIAGMKYTQTSIASIFNSTSSVFIIIFATVILKEPLTWRKSLAILLATIGVVLVSLY